MADRKKIYVWVAGGAGALAVVAASVWVYRTWFVPPTQGQIDAAVNAGQWSRAARLIERSDLENDLGRNYYSLGVAYTHLNEPDKAIAAFMKADDKAHLGGESRFQIAALYAESGKAELALQWLHDALDAGFGDEKRLAEEPAFAKLRGTAGWRAVVTSREDLEQLTPEALDYLIGTWNLTQGGFGASTITFKRQIEGLAISEDWNQTNPGANGVYVFDPMGKHWTYTYVDGYGRTFIGQVRTGRQLTVITGTLKAMDGVETMRRVEIRSSSGVIDYSVLDSRDEGRTWDTPTTWRLTAVSDQPRPSF